MPTYDYRCDDCGHTFETFQSMKDDPLRDCPACGVSSLRRIITGGTGVIFRGSGFYVNDSRPEAKKAATPTESATAAEGTATPEKPAAESAATKKEPGADSGSAASSTAPAATAGPANPTPTKNGKVAAAKNGRNANGAGRKKTTAPVI